MLGFRGSPAPSIAARKMDFRPGLRVDLRPPRRSRRRTVEETKDVPLPGGTLLKINVPGR